MSPERDEDNFDTDLFINEIQQFPSIWDYTSEAYSNRIEKAKAWNAICCKFYENFEEKDQKDKNECAVKLQKKWKGLRDSYAREVRKIKTLKSGSGAAKRRKYIFFDVLSFLKPLTEKQSTETSMTDDALQEESTAGESTDATTQPSTSFSRRAKARNQVHGNELMKKLSSRLSDRISNEGGLNAGRIDSDKLFLLSLYDRFKSIDNNQKIPAQIEILNVIRKYSKNAPSLPYTPFTNYIPTYNQAQDQSYPHNTYQPPPMNVQPLPFPMNVQLPPPPMNDVEATVAHSPMIKRARVAEPEWQESEAGRVCSEIDSILQDTPSDKGAVNIQDTIYIKSEAPESVTVKEEPTDFHQAKVPSANLLEAELPPVPPPPPHLPPVPEVVPLRSTAPAAGGVSSHHQVPRNAAAKATSRKEPDVNELIKTALSHIASFSAKQGNEYSPFGEVVANELSKMEPIQQTVARKMINDVIYMGAMGTLKPNFHVAE